MTMGRGVLLRPAEHRPNPGHQFHHAEGLGDEVVGAVVQADHPVVFRIFRRALLLYRKGLFYRPWLQPR